jgi:hypothetical protein
MCWQAKDAEANTCSQCTQKRTELQIAIHGSLSEKPKVGPDVKTTNQAE